MQPWPENVGIWQFKIFFKEDWIWSHKAKNWFLVTLSPSLTIVNLGIDIFCIFITTSTILYTFLYLWAS